ncbi:MFS transporter [Niastella yeongjuensis]|uniref:MFS transporter n=1 Tax=Niastella yeongjuensis TaxID=354355 RepID=A0A1V9F8S0_9BACT|nr:MFS transporter [Niastella yeongjuensis]OQP54637.1 MFS transporter [Niastella yeongjuensis]SEO01795.1 Predicted arabinose efflux permease, MFS family [Niastella yeongjuensis]
MSADPVANDPTSPFVSVRIKEFRLFIIQRFFFIMGMRMIATVIGWKMYQLTKNPLALAFVGLSEAVPAISLALYAGHVVDKSDKRTLLFKMILLYFLCTVAFLFITWQHTELSLGKKFVQLAIYGVMFCTGVLRSFTGPATSSILAQLVPKTILPNAVTWSSTTWLTASVLGHASAGFLVAYTGYGGTFLLIMIYVAIAATALFQIERKPIVHSNKGQATWESVKEGVRYVFKTKELLGALSLDMLAVLFGGTTAMIPFFAGDILHVGAIGFGWLNAAADIGSMFIIITLTFFPLRKKQGMLLLFVVAGFGISIISFGISTIYWLSFFALLVSGALDGISVVIRGTILQLKTPDEMRGRVSAVNSMFINSSNEIGAFESGAAAKLLGIVPSVIFGGTMTLLVVTTMWFKAPTLRKFEY